ncbi:ethanolamine ammonia-lyase subunit EutC [Tianweitania populi]|uniref:Ethanolamine ammonia-lyase small subunit n=1 Tax=Tianweitania populi TaxID=1607949 RepID=A0A8J3DQA8_9HYPH|nr:ethanolamine ammonia-lyase subunit EutC [Tianweitania populi]GHD16542.1 ethanolamine ammonia-lyase light chain [Tianweitania populi]
MSKLTAHPASEPAQTELADFADLTQARIALGRAGSSTPTAHEQRFQLDHARARAAVWSQVDEDTLLAHLEPLGLPIVTVESQAVDRADYVRRPDKGRLLAPASRQTLADRSGRFDVVIIIADGLSATAINLNAAALVASLVQRLQSAGLSLAPIVMARRARVALGDAIGETLGARVTITLIGERPGLSAADSLGAYLTYAPVCGTPDASRNCISNIREHGMPLPRAAEAIAALAGRIFNARLSGVKLGENRLTSEEPSKMVTGDDGTDT